MADLFDMNPPLNFPIPEKSIYQMGFNSTAQTTVPTYVTEPSLTNPLQLLEMLNPQNAGNEEKSRDLCAELMAPHYKKQMDIERKLDVLTETINNFIRTQQSFNEIVVEKYLRQNVSPLIEENRADEQNEEENGQSEQIIQQPLQISNPLPIYPIPNSIEPSTSPLIRNRTPSPEKMETEMSVRDFLKTTMTVQKADEKILEEERQRDKAEENIKFNKFRVRNRPKKYKRSAVTFTSTLESSGIPLLEQQATPTSSSSNTAETLMEQSNNSSVEIEENSFQPIVVPCAQRAPDLSLMQPVFPTTSSYVINTATQSNQAIPSISLPETKFPTECNNIWKAVDGVTQLLVDAPSLLESDLRSFADHSHITHHSSFLPYVGNQETHHRSAFVPPHCQKERRLYMDQNLTDTLRNL